MWTRVVFDGWCICITKQIGTTEFYVAFFSYWQEDNNELYFDTRTPPEKIGKWFKMWARTRKPYSPGQEGGTSGE